MGLRNVGWVMVVAPGVAYDRASGKLVVSDLNGNRRVRRVKTFRIK